MLKILILNQYYTTILFEVIMFKHVDEECSCEGRYCRGCAQTKCHRDFSKDSKGAFGLSSRCKDCVRDYQKSHIDQINAQRRKNRQEKADHYTAYNREYHLTY